MAKTYGASDLEVLEGLDAVRKRPGMYIGSTGQRGLHHLLWEVLDNAVDEAANGYADKITVIIHRDNSVTVEDNGRGIPVDMHPKLKMSGVEVVFTQLHAGGKFNTGNYAYSGGLHGVGASVVNALSRYLIAEVAKDGVLYRQEYRSTVKDDGTISSGKPVGPLEKVKATRKKGTTVTYMPDDRVFETTAYNIDTIKRRLREIAFLNKGLTISFTDEKSKNHWDFKYDGGICDYVKYMNKDKTTLFDEPVHLEGESDGIKVEIAFSYTDGYTENICSFVNNIPTTEGGTHEVGFKTAYTKVLNEYARKNSFLKEKDNNLTGEDYREGITAVISLKMGNVQFEGQTKAKLGNTSAKPAVDAVVSSTLPPFLDNLSNANVLSAIVEKAIKSAKVREASRKAKENARAKNKLKGAPLVGKLASCTGRKPEQNELFIVEGDSAGGSAKQGRDRRSQAILPLKGKPLNVEKKRIDQVLANDEFRSIITALDTGIEEDFNIKKLKYHKIIILSDADQDGAHIRAILLTFFFRYMRPLITGGHVFIGVPPLYKMSTGKSVKYAYSDKELLNLTKGKKNYTIQRYKGLGEMNPDQLWETTLNPENRALIRVTIDDVAEADRMVTVLMGEKTEPRKEYISEFAEFNKQDLYESIGEIHG